MEHPTAPDASHPYDCVMVGDRTVGVSFYPAYLSPDRQWISLAVLDTDVVQMGNEVTLIWGERNGGSAKPGVERHFQKKVRAVVTPWPYARDARANYRKPA